jgi:hypothetical protein
MNRPQEKPFYFERVKEYLKTKWKAVVAPSGLEGDDELGIRHMAGYNKDPARCTTILCSKDKDLKMIPGWRYNWGRDVIEYISKETADKWLWIQMLVGDTADNISGIKGLGIIKATTIINEASWPENTVKNLYARVHGESLGNDLFIKNKFLLTILREYPV